MENLIKKSQFINMLYRNLGSLFFKFLGLFVRVDEKTILFSSGMGKAIFDSPLIVYNSMKKDPFFNDFNLIWAVKDVSKYEKDYQVVKIDTPAYFLTALKAKVWITSVNIERGLKFKKKETLYFNTWHGIPLKYIGMDVKARKDYNLSHVDFFLSSGQYENEIYQRAFNISKSNLLEIGLPRNIKLETEKDHSQVALKQSIIPGHNLNGKKVVLFCPTWKDHEYNKLDLDSLSEKLGSDYTVLLRSHPLEKWHLNNNQIIDVSGDYDLIELMLVSDILISDYSSVMVDFAILNKPIFAYIPDYEQYKSERGLYVSKNEVAPNVVEDLDTLVYGIQNLDASQEKNKSENYKKHFMDLNSNISDQIIIEKIKDGLESR